MASQIFPLHKHIPTMRNKEFRGETSMLQVRGTITMVGVLEPRCCVGDDNGFYLKGRRVRTCYVRWCTWARILQHFPSASGDNAKLSNEP